MADNDAIVSANAPVVSAAVAERDASPVALTTIDGTVYNPLSTTNFCGLPGMFCEASNVVGANGPTVVEAPNMTALAQRAPEPAPAPLTTIDGTVYNPLRTTNFCGLPGMFCNEDNVADATAPTELETPAITQRVPEPLAAPLTTIDGTVYNPLHSVGFCGLPGMFCAEDSVAEMDGPVKADAPMVTAIAERAPQPLPLTTIDGTVYNPLHSVGFCGLPGMFCGFEDNEDAQKGSHTQVSRCLPFCGFYIITNSTQVQSGATPSLESPLPNPVGSIPYIPFPTLDPEKRDQEDEAPLPLRNTKTLVHDNMAPKAGANSTFKFGWQLVLGFIIGIVGSLVLL